MVNENRIEIFSIEWLEKEYKQFETFFLHELNNNKGHVLQTIFWLNNEPRKDNHIVQISLDFSDAPVTSDFYLELHFEPDGKLMISIVSRDNEKIIGFVHLPPIDTFSESDWNRLSEKYLELIKNVEHDQLLTPTIKTSIYISYKTQEFLKALGEYFNQDVSEIINEIIEGVVFESRWIMGSNNLYKVPMNLNNIISNIFSAGSLTTDSLFQKILEKLDVKGFFTHNDMEINLDEMSMWISFAALKDSGFYIDSFDITLMNTVRLVATYFVENNKDEIYSLSRIKNVANNIRDSEMINLPEIFQDLMDFDIYIEEDDDYFSLNVDITEESLDHLPSINDVSELFKQLVIISKG